MDVARLTGQVMTGAILDHAHGSAAVESDPRTIGAVANDLPAPSGESDLSGGPSVPGK